MTQNNKLSAKEGAIPLLKEASVFANNPSARFGLGVIARATTPPEELNGVFQGYLQLRANVYIDQTRFLDETYKRDDGTEIDGDDKRSTHIVALENRLSHIAVVGSMRVIEKTVESDDPLPIESFFSDELGQNPLPIGANEISRYIQQLEDRRAGAEIRTGLFIAALAHINTRGLTPTLAVVEPSLEHKLHRGGVPLERIAEPKKLDKYNDDPNVGIKIDTMKFAEQFGGQEAMQAMNTEPGAFTFWGNVDNK